MPATTRPLGARCFQSPLHAALTLDEVRACCRSAGLAGVEITQVPDRHWVVERAFCPELILSNKESSPMDHVIQSRTEARAFLPAASIVDEYEARDVSAHPLFVRLRESPEIFAKKMDRCLGDEVRRQNAISDDALTWLTIHEVLEVDHAEDSGALAALVTEHGPSLAATWRGAIAQWDALWEFLDGVAALALTRETA